MVLFGGGAASKEACHHIRISSPLFICYYYYYYYYYYFISYSNRGKRKIKLQKRDFATPNCNITKKRRSGKQPI
jgi:hypothetical protein